MASFPRPIGNAQVQIRTAISYCQTRVAFPPEMSADTGYCIDAPCLLPTGGSYAIDPSRDRKQVASSGYTHRED
jgi:hypothetical protein